MKLYPNLFRFDIFIVRCLGGYFFSRHSVYQDHLVDLRQSPNQLSTKPGVGQLCWSNTKPWYHL